MVSSTKEESFLKPGNKYEQSRFSQERDRIDDLLKNNGYFDFNKQFVQFEVDSTLGNYMFNITTIINLPSGQLNHKVFYIDSVKFQTDANITTGKNTRTKERYNNVVYEYFKDRFSKKVLDSRLFLYPDQVYKRDNAFDTQRQLANLDMFRFVNINYDTVGGKMVANIYASPLKKFQTSNEVGLGINVTQGFPGPFYNLSVKNRNLFGGLEILEFNGRLGVEGLPLLTEQSEIYSSLEISGKFSLTFPQFLFPFSNRIRSSTGALNPKTRITFGDTYINRPDYKRNNLNGSMSYNWVKKNKQFVFTLNEINLIDSNISDEFAQELEDRKNEGSNLFRSFDPSFVSNMSLATSINFNKYGLGKTKAAFMKIYVESGGTTLNLFSDEQLTNIFDSLEYYKYIKVNIDYRKTHPITRRSSIAFRLNAGMAKPYSNNNILPYEKYFFGGGSNGMRAWRPRRLGPGSFTPINVETGLYDERFEQFGEIILEGSIEVRRKLFGFVDGAIFIDAGNVWTFDEEESRVGGDFKLNRFYKEIAVGSGVGLRFDFSFLVLRFDGALKVYDPARDEGARFFLSKAYNDPLFQNQKQFLINIGIGYPF
jgi:outer membrane protein assembly factor BamA